LVTPPPDSPVNGEYGGIFLGYSTTTTNFWTQSVQADIFNDPAVFTVQSAQAADYGYNFLTALSRGLPPLVLELSIAGAGVGGAPAIINVNGSPINFRISENRTQAVSVNVYVQDTNQAIVTSGDAVTLGSFRSTDGLSDSTSLPGPNTWTNNQVSLFGTLGTDMTLLPFDGQLQLNWNGNVVGAPLASGTHTLCISATPYPSDTSSNPSSPLCQNFKPVSSQSPPHILDCAPSFPVRQGRCVSGVGPTAPLRGLPTLARAKILELS